MNASNPPTLLRQWMAIAVGMGAAAVLRAGAGACTPAVGGMTLVVPAGETRALSLPLSSAPSARGVVFGRVGAVGPDYVDVPDAGWIPSVLLPAVNPYYVRLRTGAAAGRVLLVEANTASRLCLNTDDADLTQPAGGPVAPGDAFELVPADTLASLFPAGTLQGGDSAARSDNVQVWGGSDYRTFYFNTTRNRWEESSVPETDCSAVVLRPDRGFLVVRRAATDLRLVMIGRVAEVAPVYWHARPGVTLLSTGSSVDLTLGSLGLQRRAGGWLGASDPVAAFTDADLVEVQYGRATKWFYFDTGRHQWQLAGDDTVRDQNDLKLPAGTPVFIHRLEASAPADAFITMPAPGGPF